MYDGVVGDLEIEDCVGNPVFGESGIVTYET